MRNCFKNSKVKIVILNIIILLLIYGAAEYYFYRYTCNRLVVKQMKFFQHYYKDYLSHPPAMFRFPQEDTKFDKKPVLVLGCSYVHGQGLEEADNITSRIIKDTNRWAYNFGQAGYGPPFTLTLMMSEEQFPTVNNPEKVIYVYMFHHLQRWNQWQFYNVLRKLNLIPFQKYNFLDNSYIYSYFRNVQIDKYYNDDKDFSKRLDLFFNIMKKIKEQSDKLFPGSEFIIVIYSDINYDLSQGIMGSVSDEKDIDKMFQIMYSEEFKKRLQDLGIKVITTEELIGRKMDRPTDRIPNDLSRPHPSNSAWDEIMPKLEKALDL